MNKSRPTTILDTCVRLIIPFYLVYAIYVLVHGHYSPGGGFQAGVVLAVSVILVQLVQDPNPRWGLGRDAAVVFACLGTFMYAGIGLLTMAWGGNMLDYGVLPLGEVEAEVRALGTLGIEIGVTMAVMGVFVVIFNLLRGEE